VPSKVSEPWLQIGLLAAAAAAVVVVLGDGKAGGEQLDALFGLNQPRRTPAQVEKGTQGVDGRVVNPKGKGARLSNSTGQVRRVRRSSSPHPPAFLTPIWTPLETPIQPTHPNPPPDQRAFVITLARAGEDNAGFKLTDIESTFAGFAGADYALQDALTDASNIARSESEKNGVQFFQYDIDSPVRGGWDWVDGVGWMGLIGWVGLGGCATALASGRVSVNFALSHTCVPQAHHHMPQPTNQQQEYRYLSSIAVKGGKVFALFVRSPTRAFGRNESDLRHIIETFELL